MRRQNFFLALAVMAIVAVAATSCTDPIWNNDPVDTTYSLNFPLEKFHEYGKTGDTVHQRELVDKNLRQLTKNVVRHFPQIQDEKNIKFILGSGYAKDVLTGSGKTHSGKYSNELIIIIDDPKVSDTLFLSCGNGMLSKLRVTERHDFGTAERWRIVIEPGKGLANYCPELERWSGIANSLDIPVMDKDGNIVPISIYSNVLGKYTSYLWPYDVIDLLDGVVYDSAGRPVDHEARIAAAKAEKAKAEQQKKNKKSKRRR